MWSISRRFEFLRSTSAPSPSDSRSPSPNRSSHLVARHRLSESNWTFTSNFSLYLNTLYPLPAPQHSPEQPATVMSKKEGAYGAKSSVSGCSRSSYNLG